MKTKQNTGNCKTTAHDAHSYSWTSTSTRRQADARILTPTGRKAQWPHITMGKKKDLC